MSERKKILWLVGWYPNKYDPFDGDFIQRHAKAAALYYDIHVLFIKAFYQQAEKEEEKKEQQGLTEQLIYLPKHQGNIGKLKSFFDWQREYKSAVLESIQKYSPQLIHVHIPWKVGLIALWAKRKFKLPFVVTEHWGIYNNIVEDSIHTKPLRVRYLLKLIYKKANVFISVSRYLGMGVTQSLLKKDFIVIPNVVDTDLFFPSEKKYECFTFLHVSNMVPLKNVEGVIASFHQFILKTGNEAKLILVGNKNDKYEKLAAELNLLNRYVFFKGEISYSAVAHEMQSSHVFVLNSNIENSPCVIGEALCCGLPVIATNVGGIPELVDANNGCLIPSRSNDELEKALLSAFENYQELKSRQSHLTAKGKYSPTAIGRQIAAVYGQVLDDKP